jgi:predicted N-acetyltransferase YhbS
MPLKANHDVSSFDCGEPIMNDWLKKRAFKASAEDTAQTYVVCRGTRRIVGYYCLSAGAVEHRLAPGAIRRNAPDPIPVIILGRIAVHTDEAGKGLARALLADAMKRSLRAAKIIGARAMLVHALTSKVATFYKKFSFRAMDSTDRTLFLPMKSIRDKL